MVDRPILFSAPMVRALLDGSKTQTRRVVKPAGAHTVLPLIGADDKPTGAFGWCPNANVISDHIACPYGQPSDRLWVRETWNWFDPEELPVERQGSRAPFTGAQGERKIHWVAAYAADGPLGRPWVNGRDKWRPSIHMPRWASRISLEVIGVRVERLQDISQTDARAEGSPPSHPSIDRISREFGYADFPRSWYAQLWEQINGAGSWAANPWVWVVEFRRITP